MHDFKKFLPLLFITFLLFCFFVNNTAAYAATVSLNPSADHYQETVTTNAPYVNTSDDMFSPGHSLLWVGYYYESASYYLYDQSAIKFDLSSISGTVTSATLKLYISNLDGTPFVNLYGSNDDTWVEASTVALPSLDTAIVSNDTSFTVGNWKTFDVTSFINSEVSGNKIATFVLTGETAGAASSDIGFYSKEESTNTTLRPILEVTYTSPATVSSVGVPSNGTYGVGQNLDFTVNYSEAVTVTGTPYIPITLDTGGTVNASYVSGSGTSALVFRYTVQTGNLDTNGVSVGASITLNGGTIKNGVADASLTLNSVSDPAGVRVDGVAPTVSSVTLPANGTYGAGQNLNFTVNFSEAVTVTGTPYIPITLNTGGAVSASYVSGSGSTALVFRYTVASGNADLDGITVGASITANGGTLKDSTNNDATLTLSGVGSTAGILVDGVAPTVSSVTLPADGTYIVGQNLDFTVNFGEAVTVNIGGGTPYLPVTLNTGGTVSASYVSGSGSTALVFRYTVASGNADPDGITVGASITANGGTLKDGANNDATLTLSGVGSTAGILVDGVAPTVSSVTLPADGTYIVGQNLDFTVNFSEAVTVTGAPYIPITLNTGGAVNASYVSGSGSTALVFRYTVASGNADPDGITVGASITANGGTLKDSTNNDATLTLSGVGSTAGILVDGVAPTVSSVTLPANGTYGAGQNLNFTVNFSEAVTVTGTPYIPITLNTGGAVNASYVSGSGSTALVFRYTVASGNADPDGITVSASITANGGTLKDGANNDATLTLSGVGSTAGILVDGVALTVSSVTLPSDGTYTVWQNLDFTVNFGEAVTVNIGGGTPYLPVTLNTGGTVSASYVSGSGSTALVFRYTVASGNADPDGITVGASITANGGTLKDGANNDATLTLSGVGSTAGILVDGVAPTVSSVTLPADATYVAGQNLDFTVNFSEAVTVNTGGGTPFMPVTLDTGGAVNAYYVSGTGTTALLFRYTVQTGNQDTDGVTVGAAITANGGTLRDGTGNDADLTLNSVGSTTAVLVDTVAPTLVNAVKTDITHITITLSENCTNIVKANDGGFTVAETGAPGVTYAVASTAQGTDASHVVLTVANMSISAKEGVTVKYTAGGSGTVQDTAGNAMATDGVGVAAAAWDTTSPTISSAALAASNAYLDITFDEGVYGAGDGATALTAAKLALTFTQNAGTATNVQISSVKQSDSAVEGSASALAGGETTVRVFLTLTGTPSGVEATEVKPVDGASIYDKAGNAVSALQTTGVKTLNNQTPPPPPPPVYYPGRLQFNAAEYKVDENAGSATITVTRTGGSNGAVTVNYTTSDGTALAGSDYTTASGVLTFNSGETSKFFEVPVLEDTLTEGDETVSLILSNPTGGAALGSQSTAMLTIGDTNSTVPDDSQYVLWPGSTATGGVAEDRVWAVKFSREVDPATIDDSSIFICRAGSGERHPVSIEISNSPETGATTATLRPRQPLVSGGSYQLYVSGSVRGKDGSLLARATRIPFTVSAPLPDDNQYAPWTGDLPAEVAPDKEWQIKFNQEVDLSTLTDLSIFVCKAGSGERHPVTVGALNDSVTLAATATVKPCRPYDRGGSYVLYVDKSIRNKNSSYLARGQRIPFSVTGTETTGLVNAMAEDVPGAAGNVTVSGDKLTIEDVIAGESAH